MRAYLDHAATSPMPQVVLDAYVRELQQVGNPASTHGHGQAASDRLEAARERIGQVLGCDAALVTLTAGGTESVNLGLKGLFWARAREDRNRNVLLIAEGEHHATIEAAEWLRDAQGAELHWMPIDSSGMLQPATLKAAIDQVGADRVALISFLWANNEVGTVQPLTKLMAVANAAGVPVHVDAIAALGQVPVHFADTGIAALSVSAHKIGGPVGVGALLIARTATVDPLLHGGSQQRARSGTQDVAGAVAFAAALEYAYNGDFEKRIERLSAMRNRLIKAVLEAVPEATLRGIDPLRSNDRLAANAHFTFDGCQGDSLVFLLDAAGVSASVGSACQAGVAEVSHVLLSMGLSETEAIGSLRFTLSVDTEESEIDSLLTALPEAVKRAKAAGLA